MGTGVLGGVGGGCAGSLGVPVAMGSPLLSHVGCLWCREGSGSPGGVGPGSWLCCGFRLGASRLFASWGVPECSLCRRDRSTRGCGCWRTQQPFGGGCGAAPLSPAGGTPNPTSGLCAGCREPHLPTSSEKAVLSTGRDKGFLCLGPLCPSSLPAWLLPHLSPFITSPPNPRRETESELGHHSGGVGGGQRGQTPPAAQCCGVSGAGREGAQPEGCNYCSWSVVCSSLLLGGGGGRGGVQQGPAAAVPPDVPRAARCAASKCRDAPAANPDLQIGRAHV